MAADPIKTVDVDGKRVIIVEDLDASCAHEMCAFYPNVNCGSHCNSYAGTVAFIAEQDYPEYLTWLLVK